MPSQTLAGRRYRVLMELGRGGMGVVWLAMSRVSMSSAYVGEAVMHRYERERATGRVVGRDELARRPENHLPLTTETTFRLVQRARGVARPRATAANDGVAAAESVGAAALRGVARPPRLLPWPTSSLVSR